MSFHSTLVRLRRTPPLNVILRLICFHSTLVRLEQIVTAIVYPEHPEFPFHSGAIKTTYGL